MDAFTYTLDDQLHNIKLILCVIELELYPNTNHIIKRYYPAKRNL